MQVMGETAVEHGFEGYLPELFEPEKNIQIGCKVLSENLKHYRGDYRKALSAYNAGRNWVDQHGATAYADKVIARIESKEIEKLITL
jgi:soluble lytic murein transglycosylase-like protein